MSQRSIQKGSPAARASVLKERIRARDKKEAKEELQKARNRLTRIINKAKKELAAQGVQARKDEKARLARLREHTAQKTLPPLEDLMLVRDPSKKPTLDELNHCSESFYESYV